MKILMSYQILCQFCKKPFQIKDLLTHETFQCKNVYCANELCSVPLEHISSENLFKFTVTREDQESTGREFTEEKIACSKKCKKVAKFGFVMRYGTENEVLKAFEGMMRKKMKKRPINNQRTLNAFGNNFARLSIGAPM